MVSLKPVIKIINNFTDTEIVLKKDENLTCVGIIFKEDPIKRVLKFKLKGEKAQLKCYFITLGKGNTKQKLETVVEHVAKNTTAEMIIKSLQLDSSSLDYTGFIVIPPAGEKTKSLLRHDILLLSEDAKIKTIPALEIKTDDVKASHSVSIGKLNEEDMFYLKTRGFNEIHAKKLLMTAFIEEILGKFPKQRNIEAMKLKLYNQLHL